MFCAECLTGLILCHSFLFCQDFLGIQKKYFTLILQKTGTEVEMEFEIDGDTLTIEVMGFDMECERVK